MIDRSGDSWSIGAGRNGLAPRSISCLDIGRHCSVPGSPTGLGKFPGACGKNVTGKRTIAVADHCPKNMLRNSPWSVSDYTVLKELGRGRASVVHQAICKTSHCPVVLKSYKKAKLSEITRLQVRMVTWDIFCLSQSPLIGNAALKKHCSSWSVLEWGSQKLTMPPVMLQQVERETKIHVKMRHKSILQCYGVFEDESTIYMVLEFAANEDLMTVIFPFMPTLFLRLKNLCCAGGAPVSSLSCCLLRK